MDVSDGGGELASLREYVSSKKSIWGSLGIEKFSQTVYLPIEKGESILGNLWRAREKKEVITSGGAS